MQHLLVKSEYDANVADDQDLEDDDDFKAIKEC